MSEPPVCPCEIPEHPRLVTNPPGRGRIDYRVGDFMSFRAALLRPRRDDAGGVIEQELTRWQPGGGNDFALLMVEWFAYLADILTFYNERIATEAYLRTATQPDSVRRLIRTLGYRPRPGIGAQGRLAALTSSRRPFMLPRGFQIQDKPGPGKQPQVFETDAPVTVAPPDQIAVDPPLGFMVDDGGNTLLVGGRVSGINPEDTLLLLERKAADAVGVALLATVETIGAEQDARGAPVTRLTVAFSGSPPANRPAAEFQLLRNPRRAHLYVYAGGLAIKPAEIHLDAVYREIAPGQPVVFDTGSASTTTVRKVTSYTEIVWFANGQVASGHPENPPADPNILAIPILHSVLGVTDGDDLKGDVATTLVHFGWQDAGALLDHQAATIETTQLTVTAVPPAAFPPGVRDVIVEDTAGNGATAALSATDSGSAKLSALPDPPIALTLPLRVLPNVLPVSRGKTVANEVLGSGDAALPQQEFVLKQAPLTYLRGDSRSGEGYASTLRIWVGGIEWRETPSFFGQPSTARIFVTREDEEQRTYVQFGDGLNGARLPTGRNNVVASYRQGSGVETPQAGTLSVVLQPFPGLRGVRNPAPVGGGADPDPPGQIRRYAPASVLTFGRAISGDDYETVAAQSPGVARARAYWSWDGRAQRAAVTIYVGDDAAARDAARAALLAAMDPNRPLAVVQARARPVQLTVWLLLDPAYLADPVLGGVRAALLDPERGLFGTRATQIGGAAYDSQIHHACLGTPGVTAVHAFTFEIDDGSGFVPDAGPRHGTGEGAYFSLDPTALTLHVEA